MRPRPILLAVLTAIVLTMLGTGDAAAAEGDLDPAFGDNGVLGPSYWDLAQSAATLPDGSLAVAGHLASGTQVGWMAIDRQGNGVSHCGVATPFLASFEGRAVLADHHGNVVVGGLATIVGSESQQRAMVARYAASSPCNTLDVLWSGNGWQLLDPENLCVADDCGVVALAESPTDSHRLFALVESKVNLLVSRYFVVAFQSDGDPDPLFGSNGFAEVAATGLGTLARGGARLAIDQQGRPLVLATRFDPVYSLDADVALVRFTTVGALDSSFENNGVAVVLGASDTDELAGPLAIAADGTIFAGARDITTPTAWRVARWPDGTWAKDDLEADIDIAAIVAEGDSRLLILSNDPASDELVISRSILYTALGGGHFWTIDGLWGPLGNASFDVDFGGGLKQTAVAMVLSGGRPVVLGNADTENPSADSLFALRAQSRYVFWDSFESGSTGLWSGRR